MIWIFNKEDLSRNKTTVDRFFEIYEHPSNFPDINEREAVNDILERIDNPSKKPCIYILILGNLSSSTVSGGAIIEFYFKSNCALLTYIFLQSEARGVGLAKKIIQSEEGLRKGVNKWESQMGQPLKMFFFEANSPTLTTLSNDSMNPIDRLRFFKANGAKILDIPYVQPPLDIGKHPVENLLILTFPFMSKNKKGKFYSNLFFAFYYDLCNSLEVDASFYQSQIKKIRSYLTKKYKDDKFIYLLDIEIEDA